MKKLIIFSNNLIRKLFDKIQHSTELPEWHASIFRIVFGTFVLLFATPFYGWIGDAPQSFFNPPYLSAARWYNGFPPGGILEPISNSFQEDEGGCKPHET